jgi:hypothetical protein
MADWCTRRWVRERWVDPYNTAMRSDLWDLAASVATTLAACQANVERCFPLGKAFQAALRGFGSSCTCRGGHDEGLTYARGIRHVQMARAGVTP